MRSLLCCCLMFVGCGPHKPPAKQARPDRVSADTLVMSFRAKPPVYQGRIVQVTLPPGRWKVHPDHIAATVCDADDAIRFKLGGRPASYPAGATLVITGTCTGIIFDGRLRCANPEYDWYVRVDGCTVAEMP